ncbi:hypothetical protein AK812_SmicGene43123 [Symbiodinium microadriaticum]|uniref:Uncharacterized protein n=1 Tax=Symbiodinium microadriaticum TaxID=2951 RepID=A0A1Q9C1T9_SYMMI|nr:hypothetical protein AK812_SmicGene43123 [Symbiodinium microadriaticum]
MDDAAQHNFLDLAKTRQWLEVQRVLLGKPHLVNAQPCGRFSAILSSNFSYTCQGAGRSSERLKQKGSSGSKIHPTSKQWSYVSSSRWAGVNSEVSGHISKGLLPRK